MARTSNMMALVSGQKYLCALRGYSVAEADGWLKPAAAAEVVAEVDADLKAMSDRANALAALQREMRLSAWGERHAPRTSTPRSRCVPHATE